MWAALHRIVGGLSLVCLIPVASAASGDAGSVRRPPPGRSSVHQPKPADAVADDAELRAAGLRAVCAAAAAVRLPLVRNRCGRRRSGQ